MNCDKCQTPIPDDSRFCSACGADVSGDSLAHEATVAMDEDLGLFTKLQEELGSEYILEKELGRGGMAVVHRAFALPGAGLDGYLVGPRCARDGGGG